MVIKTKQSKMADDHEKAIVSMWYHENKSVTLVRRRYRREFGRNPPSEKTIRKWFENLTQTGHVDGLIKKGRKAITIENVNRIRTAFEEEPRQSLRHAARHLDLNVSSIHKVLRKKLRLFPYKLQRVQALEANDFNVRVEFARHVLTRQLTEVIAFSDEATFFQSGCINRHNVRIWGTRKPTETLKMRRNSPKVNVWCALTTERVIGPFFFAESTVTATTYLDMLEHYAVPQIKHLQREHLFFQQDGAPPHWGLEVREFLDQEFPNRWIGRDGPIAWPPRSPDLTPLDFFFWGYVKDCVFNTPVRDLNHLKQKIHEAVDSVTAQMLRNTWRNLRRRLELLCENGGAHVEV